MEKGDWGSPERVWGLEPYYDPGRAIEIYEAVKGLGISSILDVACGTGLVLESLFWAMPCEKYHQFDIQEYPEWKYLRVTPFKDDLTRFIKTDDPYHLVLMLNSYRNWDEEPRSNFNQWLKRNAKYFITSGEVGPTENWSIIGTDVKGHDLKLYNL